MLAQGRDMWPVQYQHKYDKSGVIPADCVRRIRYLVRGDIPPPDVVKRCMFVLTRHIYFWAIHYQVPQCSPITRDPLDGIDIEEYNKPFHKHGAGRDHIVVPRYRHVRLCRHRRVGRNAPDVPQPHWLSLVPHRTIVYAAGSSWPIVMYRTA